MDHRNCKECEQPIKGRTDKRFCNDNCRNAFNNRENSKEYNILKKINTQLRKNRKILSNLLAEEKMIKISKNKLLGEGFSMVYHTHRILTTKGQQYIFCYEYGYLEIGQDYILIVKSKEKKREILGVV
ncbi:hypothetical protein [Sphingobacterium cellulitidis]|uniref:hypothetical protein n=1 Tax=Sphingobacterium cellulitidis TaxID=1768011 RepID=UPI003C7D4376